VESVQQAALAGSSFEIEDGNLRVDNAGMLDWANVAELRKVDILDKANDDSFGEGTKEDTAAPTVVDGSIPPNKSDLLTFGVYLEKTAAGKRFLNVFWRRVQDPSGTTNMDFEFNQSKTPSANGVTPVRTAGDILVMYDLAQGGTSPTIAVSKWVASGPKSQCEAANSTPCWGTRVPLGASVAAGSINTLAISDTDSDGLGAMSARTFGEASIDFDALTGGGGNPQCTAFGSAYLKSRSSDSFTAALKDFIAPEAVNISNCGSIKIHKVDDGSPPSDLAGAKFKLVNDVAPTGCANIGPEDTQVGAICTTDSNGLCTFQNVFQGNYLVIETQAPVGFDLATPSCQPVTVVADQEVSVTFIDPRQRGAIQVTKTRKHAADGTGDHPQAGVDFSITVNGSTVTQTTDANGVACFDNLLFGSYTVHESTPAGYQGEADKTVVVDNKASCAGSPYVGETTTFHNTPLSNITVSFESQVSGGTAAKISCTGLLATPPDGTPNAFDDTSETFKDLVPGTYNCTVVIDP
jgi:hypothetical protein